MVSEAIRIRPEIRNNAKGSLLHKRVLALVGFVISASMRTSRSTENSLGNK